MFAWENARGRDLSRESCAFGTHTPYIAMAYKEKTSAVGDVGARVFSARPTRRPERVVLEPRVAHLAAGAYHSLVSDGAELFSFGDNSYGQLGTGDAEDRQTPTPASNHGID